MRIVLLLSVLFVIVLSTWMTEKRMAAWERPILVTIYPIIADEQPSTERFVRNIGIDDFEEINEFITRESNPYGFTVTPAFRIQLAAPSRELPPDIPQHAEPHEVAWWSLKMRWWSMRQGWRDDLVSPDIQMFVIYHSLDGNDELGISVGMRKGRYGIVKAYARRGSRPMNRIVLTHELLHVLGATDKYVLATGEPIYPEGYADPDRRPLFPQQQAEIMGGRIPVTAYSSVMPGSLAECRIGKQTAVEIGFFARLQE
jgi:hypothetical protein